MKSNNFMKSRKGDISITLLAIMTFVLCVVALFIFATHQASSERKILGSSAVSDFYVKEEIFRYHIFQVARNVTNSNAWTNSEDYVSKFQQSYLSMSPSEYLTNDLKQQIMDKSKYKITIENIKGSNGQASQNIIHVIISGIKYSQNDSSSSALITELDSTKDFKADFIL